MKLTILVDMDDTIENLTQEWVNYLNEKYGLSKKWSDIKEWDMTKAFPMLSADQVFEPLMDNRLWERVKPLPGAVDNIKKIIDDGNRIFIVTSSHLDSLKMKMYNVLFKYFTYLTWDNVIITADKSMIHGDIIIDDKPSNLEDGRWYLRLLMDAPHNRYYELKPLMRRVYGWDEIYQTIKNCGFRR